MSGISEFFRQKMGAPNAIKKQESPETSAPARSISDIHIEKSTFGKYQKGYNRLDKNSSLFGANAMDSEKPVIESESASAYGDMYFNGNKPTQNKVGLVDKMQMANNFKENQAQNLPPATPVATPSSESSTAVSMPSLSLAAASSGGKSSNPFG